MKCTYNNKPFNHWVCLVLYPLRGIAGEKEGDLEKTRGVSNVRDSYSLRELCSMGSFDVVIIDIMQIIAKRLQGII